MANVVSDKLEQAIQIKDQIRTAANAKNAAIPEDAPFADYPGYLNNLPDQLEDVPITLDFTNGDQTITAADGTVVKSAVVQKPDTLIPENIAEGVNIAGIVGTLVAGGADVKMAFGTFAGTGGVVTVEHGLGVVPDILFVGVQKISTDTKSASIKTAFGVSEALQTALGTTWAHTSLRAHYAGSNSNYKLSFARKLNAGSTLDGTGVLNDIHADASTFRVGVTETSDSFQTDAQASYDWVAIGGLT